MCSGRVSENMVLRAFAHGAAMVLVSGPIGANVFVMRRVAPDVPHGR